MKVATDALTGNDWFFEDGWYIQKSNGKLVSKLSLKNFPDPFEVWAGKVKKSEQNLARTLTSQEKEILKPRQYIFDIWAHRESQ